MVRQSRTTWFLQKIVKNDAMKEDPPEIYGWRVYMLACSACFGAMCFGWDSSVIGGVIVLPPFTEDFKLGHPKSTETQNLNGNIVSTLQAGCFLGALIASPITDRIGRRPALLGVAAIIIVGVIMQAAALGNLGLLYAGRFIAGVGVGGASTINPTYVSENAPRSIRGLLTGLYQLFIVTGGMIAFWINYAMSLHHSGKFMYVFPLAIQALPALLLFVCMFLCKESPRWLARQDRWEEAKTILARTRNLEPTHPYLEEEFQEIVDQLEYERRLVGDATYWNLQKEMWTIAGNRKRVLISIGLMVCQQMTGTNAINTYAPIIFQNLGLTGTTTSLFSTGIYGLVKVFSCIAFLLFMADSLGRRRSLLWTSIAQGLAMLYIGIYVRVSPPKGEQVPPAGYFAVVCVFLFAAFFQFGWGPACWIYSSEIPSARLRSMNVSYAAATQWLFNFVVARTVPLMLVTVGGETGYGTYLLFASFCFSMFFFVWFLIPETKGLSLEAMDALFGVTEAGSKTALNPSTLEDEKNGAAQIEVKDSSKV